MKDSYECEYKCLITYEQFQLLKNIYPGGTTFRQVNHYYDNAELILRQRKISLRIRQVNHRWIFTLKVNDDDGVREIEFAVARNSLSTKKIAKLRQEFSLPEDLEELGTLETVRTEVPLVYGVLCIDENHYLGQTDYELEFECPDFSEATFHEFGTILQRIDACYKQAPGKYHRFTKAFKKLKR
ncbi:MAG: CYTH domain-containing protein [Erysipelotrichaceae bacterium]|nr:CYTH domain-containing protein [Erysipelotrichaceae bacterium]